MSSQYNNTSILPRLRLLKKIVFLIVIILALSTLPLYLHKVEAASTISAHVPQDHTPIQAVMSASSSGETISIASGTYDENIITTNYLVEFNGSIFLCSVVSNSSVSGFTFSDEPQKKITLNVTGETGTAGICNITIPKQLIEPPYIMLMDGVHAYPSIVTLKENATHTSFCYNYIHSTHLIEIIGTQVVPEFPTIIANITVLAVLSLMLLFIYSKKTIRKIRAA